MIYEEVKSSQITPVREEEKEVKLKDLDRYLVSSFTKLDVKNYSLFDNYSTKSVSNILTDVLKSFEDYLKEKNINNPENVLTIDLIFDTISKQVKLLNNLNLSSDLAKKDLLVIFSALLLQHLKKNFS